MIRILKVACGVCGKLWMRCVIFHRQLVERRMHILVTVFVSFEAPEVVLWKNEMLWACMSCRLLLLKRRAGVCGGLWDFADNLSKTWYESGRNETALCAAICGFVCELFLLLHVLGARAQVAIRGYLYQGWFLGSSANLFVVGACCAWGLMIRILQVSLQVLRHQIVTYPMTDTYT